MSIEIDNSIQEKLFKSLEKKANQEADFTLIQDQVGLSSGNIARYLFHGIPVIINDETSLVNLVKDYQCGVVIKQWDELSDACHLIKENHSKYSQNACECFRQILSVENNFQKIRQDIFNYS